MFLPGEFHGRRNLVGYSPWGQRVGQEWVANAFTFSLSVCFASIELFSSLLKLSSAVFRLPLNTFFTSAILFSYSKILICFFFRVLVSLDISHPSGKIFTINPSFSVNLKNISIILISKFLSSNSDSWVFCQFASSDQGFLLCYTFLLLCIAWKVVNVLATLFDPRDCSLPDFSRQDSPGRIAEVGCHSLL